MEYLEENLDEWLGEELEVSSVSGGGGGGVTHDVIQARMLGTGQACTGAWEPLFLMLVLG
jgi:hypothetical protein